MHVCARVCVFEILEEKVRVCSYIDCYYIMTFLLLTSVFKATLINKSSVIHMYYAFYTKLYYTSYVCCLIHSTLIHVNIAINSIIIIILHTQPESLFR